MPLGIRCYWSDTSPKMAKYSLSARRPVKIIFYQSGSEKFLYIGDKSKKKNNIETALVKTHVTSCIVLIKVFVIIDLM